MAALIAPHIGLLPAGPRNAITDVDGVTVGHHTLNAGDVQTGVTVMRPTAATRFATAFPRQRRSSTVLEKA